MPEGNAELPDEGMPEDIEDSDDDDDSCGVRLADVLRAPKESLSE